MLRSFEGTTPSVADSAYVDPAAVVIGDVVLEASVTVGHNAIVHAATVAEGTEIPPGTLAVGSPASVKTDLEDPDTAVAAEHYRELATRYEESSEPAE